MVVMKSLMSRKFRQALLTLGLAFSLSISGCTRSSSGTQNSSSHSGIVSVEESIHNHSQSDPSLPTDQTNPEMPEEMKRQIDFDGLKTVNPETIGWISIPGTSVDYPVMQTQDANDAKYLTTSFEGENTITGSIYIEKYNNPDFGDNMTVMYGHTLMSAFDRYDAMFTDLKKFADPDFVNQHPYIYLYTPEKTLQYQIFNCGIFDDRYILDSYDFSSFDGIETFVRDVKAIPGSVNDEKIQIDSSSRILTLSTCVHFDSSERRLVNAVQICELDLQR